MDDLAVARGSYGADAFGGFQNDNFTTRLGQPSCNSQADHPGTDDNALDLVHGQFGSVLAGLRSFHPVAALH
jgi:hypothetical protein